MEKFNKREVNKSLSEEDIKARDKNRLWAVGALVGSATTALSPIGQAVSNSFNNDLFSPEVVSTRTDKLEINKEKIKVTIDDVEVASLEIPQSESLEDK